jgi:hypothetical protein
MVAGTFPQMFVLVVVLDSNGGWDLPPDSKAIHPCSIDTLDAMPSASQFLTRYRGRKPFAARSPAILEERSGWSRASILSNPQLSEALVNVGKPLNIVINNGEGDERRSLGPFVDGMQTCNKGSNCKDAHFDYG